MGPVSLWEGEELWDWGWGGHATLQIYLTPLNRALTKGYGGASYVMDILLQLKLFSEKKKRPHFAQVSLQGGMRGRCVR